MSVSGTWSARFALLLMAAAGLAGCATRPHFTRTTVVLMPENDGKVGAVSVSTGAGTQLLDGVLSFTTVSGTHAAPSKAMTMSPQDFERAYGALLKAQPPNPRTFILHFLLDKTELTDESKALLPTLFRAVRERKPSRIMVFGHADALGSQERNLKLSADRAEAAAALIRTIGAPLGDIEVQFFGDTKPMTQSAPRAPEPRNRRVEILML